MKKIMSILFCCISITCFSFEGKYKAVGYDPYDKEKYAGIVEITRDKEGVYQGKWLFDNGEHFIGTGLETEEGISFTFMSIDNQTEEMAAPLIGLQVYKLVDTKLEGAWVLLGKALKGRETLTLIGS